MAILIILFVLVLFMPLFSIIFFMNMKTTVVASEYIVGATTNAIDASSLWIFLGAYIFFMVTAIGCIIWNSFSIKKGRKGKGVVGLVFSIVVLVLSLAEFAIFGGLLLPHVA